MASTLISRSRPAFTDLLRHWRRAQNLSQGELAGLAEVSQRHVSFLESGRSAPSRDMVLRLAAAMDMPLREQNNLLQAAGFAAVYTEHNLERAELDVARRAVALILKHQEPYGAVVVDRNWNLIMMNEANLRLFSEFVDPLTVWEQVGGDRPNMLRVTLHERGLRPYVVNWQTFAGYFLGQLDRELIRNPFNREARELLDEIRRYPDMPAENPTLYPDSQPLLTLQLRKGDLELKLFTMMTTFGTPHDVTLQELRIESFFPADETTEAYLRGQPG
ncbi:MAG: helix-turn-helix domain-containing protein [Pseudomonadota bacterium]